MPLNTQVRSPLTLTVQQHANRVAASLVCDQAVIIDTDYTMSHEKDLVRADTTGGDLDITLPAGNIAYAFKPYKFQKIVAGNQLIIQADPADANGIEGNPSITITGENEMVVLYWDPDFAVWRRSFPGGAASGVAGAALSDLSNVSGVILQEFADDVAAAAGGIPVGSQYRTGSVMKIRVA